MHTIFGTRRTAEKSLGHRSLPTESNDILLIEKCATRALAAHTPIRMHSWVSSTTIETTGTSSISCVFYDRRQMDNVYSRDFITATWCHAFGYNSRHNQSLSRAQQTQSFTIREWKRDRKKMRSDRFAGVCMNCVEKPVYGVANSRACTTTEQMLKVLPAFETEYNVLCVRYLYIWLPTIRNRDVTIQKALRRRRERRNKKRIFLIRFILV